MKNKIVIIVSGGIVQDVIGNTPLNYIIADRDVQGSFPEENITCPRALRKHCGDPKYAGRILKAFEQQGTYDPPAVAETLAKAKAVQS